MLKLNRRAWMILIVSIACTGTFEAVLFWSAIQPPVGCGSCTIFGCTVTPGCIPEFMLVTESYKVSSPTLVTMTMRNVGRGKGQLGLLLCQGQRRQLISRPNMDRPHNGQKHSTVTRLCYRRKGVHIPTWKQLRCNHD